MRLATLALAVSPLVCACQLLVDTAASGGEPGADAAPDGGPNQIPPDAVALRCGSNYESSLVKVRNPPVQLEDVAVPPGSYTIDTSSVGFTQLTNMNDNEVVDGLAYVEGFASQGGEPVLVVMANSLSFEGVNIRATGDRPFMLASMTSMTFISGGIDVRSGGAADGAGATPPPFDCFAFTGAAGQAGTNGATGGGGGAGGGVGAGGVGGGAGDAAGGVGGPATDDRATVAVRGGCPGGDGGSPTGGPGGAGGGAVVLFACNVLAATSDFQAGGEGGQPSPNDGAGGGGGAGGLIAFETGLEANLTGTNAFANGGGGAGGGGSGVMEGQDGADGPDGAAGGNGGTDGAAGGRGGALNDEAGPGDDGDLRGGGGGGGAGRIVVVGTLLATPNNASPSLELLP